MTAVVVLDDQPLMTLDEFQDWHPDGVGPRYELIEGEIVVMEPTGPHSMIGGKLSRSFWIAIGGQPYFIPRECVVQSIDTNKTGYRPDVIVLDERTLNDDPLWLKRSRITRGDSVILVVEIVSTNWRDDYLKKLADYEALGIPEYWIVDYLGLAATRYIGKGKPPTLTIYQLVNGEYQAQQFRGDDRIQSSALPELNLTANQVFLTSVA